MQATKRKAVVAIISSHSNFLSFIESMTIVLSKPLHPYFFFVALLSLSMFTEFLIRTIEWSSFFSIRISLKLNVFFFQFFIVLSMDRKQPDIISLNVALHQHLRLEYAQVRMDSGKDLGTNIFYEFSYEPGEKRQLFIIVLKRKDKKRQQRQSSFHLFHFAVNIPKEFLYSISERV